MENLKIGDRVRCIEAIPPLDWPGIPVNYMGTIQEILPFGPFPVRVLWDSSVLSKRPFICGVTREEIELD